MAIDDDFQDARAMHKRLREFESRLDQGTAGIVHSNDGRVYLVMNSLREHQVEIEEPYQSQMDLLALPPIGIEDEALNVRNQALITQLEERLYDFGVQTPMDRTNQHLLARANPAAIKPLHPFQVIWRGTTREWIVSPGSYFGRPSSQGTESKQVDYKQTLLRGSGWIVIRVVARATNSLPYTGPGTPFDGDYDVTAHSMSLKRTVSNTPISVSRSDEERPTIEGQQGNRNTFLDGEYYEPIAYVEEPGRNGRRAPFIMQIATTDMSPSF